MKSFMPSRFLIVDVICMLLILLFIYAAINKIMEFDKFQAQIGKSPLIMNYANFFAVFVPSIEILVSLMLLVRPLRLTALLASYTLMLTFTFYIAFILTFSPYVPCSCGGILNKMGWTEHLVFNGVFTLIALLGVIIQKPVTAPTAGSRVHDIGYSNAHI